MVFKQSDLILNFDRIRADVTDFIRGNPITAGAVALGVPLSFLGIAAVGKRIAKRRKKKKTTRRKKTNGRRKTTKRRVARRKRVTHRSPRHKGHKRVSFVTKDGKRVNFLVKKTATKHTHRRRRR